MEEIKLIPYPEPSEMVRELSAIREEGRRRLLEVFLLPSWVFISRRHFTDGPYFRRSAWPPHSEKQP